MRIVIGILELLLPGLLLYRRGRPVAAFLLCFLFLSAGMGLATYYLNGQAGLSIIVELARYDTTRDHMGLIPRVEQTYLVFNPARIVSTMERYDIRLATPIWPDNHPMPYPEFPLMVKLYHGLFITLLATHLLLWRRSREKE